MINISGVFRRLIFGVTFFMGMALLYSCLDAVQWLVKDYKPVKSQSQPVSHNQWDAILEKYLIDGLVDYAGLKDTIELLDRYLDTLSAHHPNDENWSREEAIAYWINAYNAFTVKLITDNYPVSSIKDIKKGIPFVSSVWDKSFIQIEGKQYSLNQLEHSILRDHLEEYRVHFVLNCASTSCPDLPPNAITAKSLNDQLDHYTKEFLSDTTKNKLGADGWQLSKIFKWYKSDFDTYGGVEAFILKYYPGKGMSNLEIDYLDYDWSLNNAEALAQ